MTKCLPSAEALTSRLQANPQSISSRATMADRLSQLQDAIDQVRFSLETLYLCPHPNKPQMATQLFSALRYIGTHHDAVPVGSEAKVTDETGISLWCLSFFRGAKLTSPLQLSSTIRPLSTVCTLFPGSVIQRILSNIATSLSRQSRARPRPDI